MANNFFKKMGIPCEEPVILDCKLHFDKKDPLSLSSKQLTEFFDAVNPIDEKHPQRINDIDCISKVKDPDLQNAMLKSLSKVDDGFNIDTTGMTDDEIADLAIPQGMTFGEFNNVVNDIIAVRDSLVPSEPVPSEPVPSVESAPSVDPVPTSTE